MTTSPDDTSRRGEIHRLLETIAAESSTGVAADDARSPAGRAAAEALMAALYEDLKRIASAYMSRERAGHSLSPTELVHEAYFRMVGQERVEWQGRTHFLGIAAQAMRRLLVDRARRHLTEKRGGEWRRVTLEDVGAGPDREDDLDAEELLALDAAMQRLAELDPRQATIVEMRYFGGMSVPEVAQALGIGRRTVDRDWAHARSWLRREVSASRG